MRLEEILLLVQQFRRFIVSSIPKESNKGALTLAQIGSSLQKGKLLGTPGVH